MAKVRLAIGIAGLALVLIDGYVVMADQAQYNTIQVGGLKPLPALATP